MALYVAPRALATVLPLRGQSIREGTEVGAKRVESLVFAASAAVVMTAARYGGREHVRGFIGRSLKGLMEM
jgi:hypothetical protein